MRVFLVLVALLGAPQIVAAQTPDTTSDVEKARAKYETAARLFDVGQHEQALQGFKDAYMLSEAAELLINIGQCYRALQRNQEAIQSFESYLRVAPTGEHRDAVEQTLIELRAQQAKEQPAALQTEDNSPKTPLTQQPVFYYSIGGVLGASGLLLGGISLGNAIEARQSFDANLLAQSQQQFRKARTTAAIADAFLIGGCVGMYIGYRKNAETHEKEDPIGSIKIKKQQLVLSVYF